MRVLLVAAELVEHEVRTAPQMRGANLKNGELLNKAQSQFDVFITVDRNPQFQQRLDKYDIALVVLPAPSNRLVDLKPLAPKVLTPLLSARKREATLVF